MAKSKAKQIWWNEFTDARIRVWGEEIKYKRSGKKATFMRGSTSLGRKNEDGTYDNAYFDVKFSKDAEVEIVEGANELIASGFITVDTYEDKQGVKRSKAVVVITACEVVIE